MTPGIVYRCYDSANRLLYVGTTNGNVDPRITHHRYTRTNTGGSAWVDRLARVEIDRYPDWREAMVAEAALIAALDPEGNTRSRRPDWSHSPAVDGYRSLVIRSRQVAA